MKTLYLHIGTPKTGTTSIQKFLQINNRILEQHGYCFPQQLPRYPGIGINRNAHFMITNQYLEDGKRDKKREHQILQEGIAQIADIFRLFDNVVLSDETLWKATSSTHKKVFPYLIEESQNIGFRIKIIVYLRRQDEFLISLWNQSIKRNAPTSIGTTFTIEERISRELTKSNYLVDYAAKLDSLQKLFGKENLIVRRFSKDDWINGSIIDDFMHCIGLDRTDEFLPLTEQTNPGLQGNTTEIKRIINHETNFSPEESLYLGNFLRELAPESGRRYPCAMLSQEEIRELLHKFEKGNERVATEYIQDGKPLFSDEIKDLPKWQADNPYMMEDVIRFFSAVSIDLRRENAALRKETEVLRKELSQLQTTVKNEQQNLRTFKYKVKHPLRALWARLFHRNA